MSEKEPKPHSEPHQEDTLGSRDVSTEFTSMEATEWNSWTKKLDAEALSVTVDYTDKVTARRLKAWLESAPERQKREVTIRATKAQKMEAANEFASGIKWEEVAEK